VQLLAGKRVEMFFISGSFCTVKNGYSGKTGCWGNDLKICRQVISSDLYQMVYYSPRKLFPVPLCQKISVESI
jgi:hypothetical protein